MEIKLQRSKLERRKGNKKNNRTERAIVEKKKIVKCNETLKKRKRKIFYRGILSNMASRKYSK